jgi:hypothetical protein
LHHPGKKIIFPVRWGAAAGALGEEIIPDFMILSAGGLLGCVFLGMDKFPDSAVIGLHSHGQLYQGRFFVSEENECPVRCGSITYGQLLFQARMFVWRL